MEQSTVLTSLLSENSLLYILLYTSIYTVLYVQSSLIVWILVEQEACIALCLCCVLRDKTVGVYVVHGMRKRRLAKGPIRLAIVAE